MVFSIKKSCWIEETYFYRSVEQIKTLVESID